MLDGISSDLIAVIEWELAHGNAVEGVYAPTGRSVVAMVRPVRRSFEGAQRVVPASLKEWEVRDSHYPEAEWLAGYESAESRQVVCGPLG